MPVRALSLACLFSANALAGQPLAELPSVSSIDDMLLGPGQRIAVIAVGPPAPPQPQPEQVLGGGGVGPVAQVVR